MIVLHRPKLRRASETEHQPTNKHTNQPMTTKILDFIDYETLRQYARTCCRQKRVRDGDAEDVAHDAWLACQRRGRAAVAKGNPEALARKIMFTSIQNAIKARKARTVPEVPLEDALALVEEYRAGGMKLKDAARRAAAETGRSRNDLYHAALVREKESGAEE